MRTYLLFTKGKAIDILKSTPRLESIIAEGIREQEKTGVGITIQVKDFPRRILIDGEEPVADQILILPLEAMSENETEGSVISQMTPAINGAAIFHEDQLIGWLNEKEARGILWLRNELESGILTVTIPDKIDVEK